MVPQLRTRGLPLQLAPEIFAAALASWIEFGRSPQDGLLAAIISNDLAAVFAFARAGDPWPLIRATFFWLHNFAPPECFGSASAMRSWEEHGGLAGRHLQ